MKPRSTFVLGALCALCLLSPLPTLAQPAPGPLWIAESQAVLELDRYSGVERSRVPGSAGALAIAVDAERELVWLLFPRQLFGHDPTTQGGPPRRIQLPETVARGAGLFILPQDGSLWVTSEDRLLGFTQAGQALPPVALPAPARKLAYDPLRNILWVAVSGAVDRLVGVDPLTAAVVEEIEIDLFAEATEMLPDPPPPPGPEQPTEPGPEPNDNDDPSTPPVTPPADPEEPTNPHEPPGDPAEPTEPTDPAEPGDGSNPDGRPDPLTAGDGILSLAVDPETSELWVGLTNALVRLSPEGEELSRLGLPSAALDLAPDRRGGVWMALAPYTATDNNELSARVVRLDADGQVGADAFPLAVDAELFQLVPDNLSVWAVGRREVVRLIRDGRVQRRFAPDSGGGGGPEVAVVIEGAALEALTSDVTPPVLTFRSPKPGEQIDMDLLHLAWDSADLDSGVDIPSVTMVYAVTQPIDLSNKREDVLKSGGILAEAPLPGVGTFTLTAQVRDMAGNLSAPTSVTVVIGESTTSDGSDPNDEFPPPTFFTPGGVDRGIQPNKIFDFQSGIDAISQSSGNLVLSIPVGQAYAVGPNLAYQLRLSYNSNVWETYRMGLRDGACYPELNCKSVVVGVPNPSSNAGLGWEMHFGQLYAPSYQTDLDEAEFDLWPNKPHDVDDINEMWLYIAPDGGQHTLHWLKNRASGSKTLPVRYSKDGSHLRMRQISSNEIHVEEPNGLINVFRSTNEIVGTLFCFGTPGEECWRFAEKRDRYGNRMWIEYPTPGSSLVEENWIVRDSTGRSHKLVFARDNARRAGGENKALAKRNGDEWGDLRRLLVKVELAGFNGSKAIWNLGHEIRTVTRGCPHDKEPDALKAEVDNLRIPVLTTLQPPGGVQPFEFTTFTEEKPQGGCSVNGGKITEVKLPSQGRMQYDYGIWSFPTACSFEAAELELEYDQLGVVEKRLLRPDDTEEGKWRYSSDLEFGSWVESGEYCSRSRYRKTTLDGPTIDGKFNRTISYHATNPMTFHTLPEETDSILGWQVTDHGLPFTKSQPLNTGTSTLFLSQEQQLCGFDDKGNPICVTEQEVWVRYGIEFRECPSARKKDPASPGCFAVNPRPILERTIYKTDGNRWVEREWSDFDGVGNARITKVRDNFSGTATVTSTTDYTATGQLFSVNGSTGYLNVGTPSAYFPATKDWILHPFSRQTSTDGGVSHVMEAQFNAQGTLTCERRWRDSGTRSNKDLVRSLTINTQGGIGGLAVTEILAGGDTANLSTGTLCDTSGNAAAGSRYQIDHSYQHGVLATSKFSGAFPYSFQATIDQNTGLPRQTFDIAGLRTDISYDGLGRPLFFTPEAAQNAATTKVSYINNPNTVARMDVENLFGSQTLTWNRTTFDFYGRPRSAWSRQPVAGGGYSLSRTTTTYDLEGRVANTSTVQQDATFDSNAATRPSQYDTLGRARQVTQPDGRILTFTYRGVRQTDTTRDLALAGGLTPVTETTTFDAQGRVVKVENPLFFSTFEYDPAGNLKRATRDSATVAPQVRTFTRDGRGFLTAESLPEIGLGSGNGSTSYTRDALGNVRTRFDGLHTLNFHYDNAGRAIQVTEPATGLTWQEWVYGTANAGSNRQLGKLIEAKRFNYPSPTAPWVVTERYEYQGTAGALSKKITLLEFPNNPIPDDFGEAFEQTYTYDSLGRVTSQSYPACIPTPDRFHQHCQDGNETAATAFTTGVTYSHGLPTAVTGSFGLSANYQYHPNLTLSRIDHGNNIVTLFDEDPSHMPRPRRIQVQRFGSNAFDSGFYAFDGAGNVQSIGGDTYVYDKASRLLSGTVKKAGSTKAQSYSYDAFDNILSVATDGAAPEDYTVNANKNRLIDPEIAYDAAGNMTRFEFRLGTLRRLTDDWVREFTYDALNMQSTVQRRDIFGNLDEDFLYIYGPGNYRLFVWDGLALKRHFTLRDLNAKPLREMEVAGFGAGAVWTHQKDFLHGPSGLIATRTATGLVKYFHHDHLGTPRLLTSTAGSTIASFHYYPFGEPATFPENPNADPAYKFTGHERDRSKVTDYMLGRTYAFPFQRFMQVDPARDGWNLYGYVGGNPVKNLDRTGNFLETAWDAFNIGLGVVSLADNLSDGNYGSAALDAGGLLLDSAATLIPFIPGGVATVIKAGRVGNRVVDTAQTVDTTRDVVRVLDDVPVRGTRGGPLAAQARNELKKSKASFERLIEDHRQKLADFQANPSAFDNKGVLRNAPPALRDKIIQGRIRAIEKQIEKQQGELKKIQDLLGE